ncbi:MAG: SGNH/GDSL hydrolase family protein [Clostridia bacterium]|nr:SGNH/GDSL hydrolase family protein [Clostridia bacterium]
MKILAVIGDSHTWGEGVGAEKSFVPPVCCGDLRPLPFAPPSYVNLLRDALNVSTGSSCSEYEWVGGKTVLPDEPLTIPEGFSLARVFFIAEAEGAEAVLSAPGCSTVSVPLQSDQDTYNVRVQVAHLVVPEGEAESLTVTLTAGNRLTIHRVELYRGAYALVNCGIGSCPVGKFVDTYFSRYVEPLSPFAILFEGCTINDWLLTPSAELYAAELSRMLAAQRGLTSRVLWHTVTPIGGSQVSGQGTDYADYVAAMRNVAAASHVPLEDCNASMEAILATMPEEARAPYFYHDPWHPNGEGHRLYAEAILPRLTALLEA